MTFAEYVSYYAKVVTILVGWTLISALLVSSAEKFFGKNKKN